MKTKKNQSKLLYVIADQDGLVSIFTGKRRKALARLFVGETVMITYQVFVDDVKPLTEIVRQTAEFDPELALYELDEASAQGFIRMVAIHTGDTFRDAVVNQLKQSMEMATSYGEN
jgi:hypothetical protein